MRFVNSFVVDSILRQKVTTHCNMFYVYQTPVSRLTKGDRRQGWQLATIDALIAAIALRYNLILLTTDQDFRAIPGLT